jgi:sterol desaturase/sphingolipid hydroxylase (fatty acid hydroxylase superfamily)
MAFEEIKEELQQIQHESKAYVESSITYYKLWGFKVAMKSTSVILKFLIIVLCLSMVLLFLSIAAAIAIGYALNNLAYGFLIIGGIYVIFTILIFLLRDKMIEGKVMAKFSEIFFND